MSACDSPEFASVAIRVRDTRVLRSPTYSINALKEKWCLYHCQRTLLGSLTIRYLPSGWLRHISIMLRKMPQALWMLRLIWLANSCGLYVCVPRITCLVLSRGVSRET